MPDIISLQEIGKCTVNLRDNYTHYNSSYPKITMQVIKGIASNVRYAPGSQTQHHIEKLHQTKQGRTKPLIVISIAHLTIEARISRQQIPTPWDTS